MTTTTRLPLPSITIPLQRKGRGAISEVHWIYGAVYIRNSPSRACLRTLVPSTVKNIYFSPANPLLVLSTPIKHKSFSDLPDCFFFNTRIHFKTTRGNRLLVRIPSRTNHRRYTVYHSRLSTLAASNKPQNSSINTSAMHLSRRIYVPLFLQASPLLVLSTPQHNTGKFIFTRPFDLNMKTHFKTTRGERLRTPSTTNVRRYIVYHSRLSTLAANNKPQNSLT